MYRKSQAQNCIAAFLFLLLAMPGQADQATEDPLSLSLATQDFSDELILDEILVTAQKKTENLQDVPISITAFQKESLEAFGIDEIEDFAANIPNVFVNSFNVDSTAARIFIRGMGQNDIQLTQDPSVALYVDGIYVGTSIGSGFESIDLQRVEVLRGPQGTLYGRNATGGAVNLITAKPSLDEWAFSQSVTTGNFDQLKTKSTLNIPLGNAAAIKLAYLDSERDGVVENRGPGEDFGTEDRENFRTDLRINPADSFTIDYAYEKMSLQDSQRLEQVALTDNSFGFLPAGIINLNEVSAKRLDTVTSLRPIAKNDVDIEGHTLTLTYDVTSDFAIKSITGKRQLDSMSLGDGVATASVDGGLYLLNLGQPGPGVPTGPGAPSLGAAHVEFEQFSQELQFLGSALDAQLDYVAGVYFYKDESVRSGNGSISLGLPRMLSLTEAKNTSFALFAQTTYSPDSLDNRWHFTLGSRFSMDNREAFRINNNAGSFLASAPDGANYDEDFTNFNPSFTVAYDVDDDTSVYAKIVSGYKSGGTSQRSASLEFFEAGFDEEEVLTYELGYKADLRDNRLRINSAIFYSEFDGFQTSLQTGPTPGDRDFIGVDNTTIQGVEIDFTAKLSDRLTAFVGYGYQESDLGKSIVNYVDSNDVSQSAQLTGELSYTPKHSAVAYVDYQIPLDNAELNFHLGYSYQADAQTSVNVADNSPIGSRNLIDAYVSLADIDLLDVAGKFKVAVWGKNLADQEYEMMSQSPYNFVDADKSITFGDPRTYGLTLTYEYQ